MVMDGVGCSVAKRDLGWRKWYPPNETQPAVSRERFQDKRSAIKTPCRCNDGGRRTDAETQDYITGGARKQLFGWRWLMITVLDPVTPLPVEFDPLRKEFRSFLCSLCASLQV